MLYRKIQAALKDYFSLESNKVLIIDGARQVGKSFIIRHVGQEMFENYIEVNLLEDANGSRFLRQRGLLKISTCVLALLLVAAWVREPTH